MREMHIDLIPLLKGLLKGMLCFPADGHNRGKPFRLYSEIILARGKNTHTLLFVFW